MRKRTRSVTPLLVLLATLTVSMIVAHSAGGGIEGKVTDPKGAAVAGASVTITTEGNPQKFTGVTDHEGHYKVEGLPAGQGGGRSRRRSYGSAQFATGNSSG